MSKKTHLNLTVKVVIYQKMKDSAHCKLKYINCVTNIKSMALGGGGGGGGLQIIMEGNTIVGLPLAEISQIPHQIHS